MKKFLTAMLAFAAFFCSVAHAAAQPQTIAMVGFSHSTPSALNVALTAINDSQKTLYLFAYNFTHPDVVKALIAAKKRGVDVKVMLDRTNQHGDSQAALVAAGIPCYVDQTYRIFHHKTMVIDGSSIENGSFNYTVSADKSNAENALYLKNVPALATAYKIEFDKNVGLPKTIRCAGGAQ